MEKISQETRRAKIVKRKLFAPLHPGVEIRRAANHEDITGALKLVHDTYVEAGYISSQDSGMRVRPWDAVPDMVTYIALKDKKVISTHSYISDDAGLGIPADRTFPEEINNLRKDGKVYMSGK